jgi:hypothetical protein
MHTLKFRHIAANEWPLRVRELPRRYAGVNVRFDIPIAQCRQSASGQPKSRLLGAHVGRSTEVRLCSKADVNLATVTDHHAPLADSDAAPANACRLVALVVWQSGRLTLR